jgi:hypothetical protein
MSVSAKLRNLISASAPLWAGEAEVVRTYWDSPVRSHATDLLWMRRQCSKEFNGTGLGEYRNLGVFLGPVTEIKEAFGDIDSGVDRHHVLDLIETLHDEFEHYVLIADIYDAIRHTDEPPINAQTLETWPEDQALADLRHSHLRRHGALGQRACLFTEGGYCTLFREGMRLAGRGGADDMIAAAFTRIFEDEFGHMLAGVVGLDGEDLSADQWELLQSITLEQLSQRIAMRNAQFSHPVAQARIDAILAGDIEPIAFDFDKAEAALAA